MRSRWVAFMAMAYAVVTATASSASVPQEAVAESQTARLTGAVAGSFRAVTGSCERWRTLAERLGETHAGHKLRQLLSTRPCALADGISAETTWSWPWRFNDGRADPPPQHHGKFGAWEIRCGEAGERRRCALMLETVMTDDTDPEVRPRKIVSHVVIANVAGRESVLWRVHVARRSAGGTAESGIAIDLPGRNVLETFDVCGRLGCMAEAEPAIGAEVASTLWLGRPITMRLGGAGEAEPETVMLPANGFRAGLKELIRLRRQEARSLAGR